MHYVCAYFFALASIQDQICHWICMIFPTVSAACMGAVQSPNALYLATERLKMSQPAHMHISQPELMSKAFH